MNIDKEKLEAAIKEIRELREFDEEQIRRKFNDDFHNKLHALEMKEPAVRNFMIMYKKDELTFEQALIGMVLTLAEQKQHLHDELVKVYHNSTFSSFRP